MSIRSKRTKKEASTRRFFSLVKEGNIDDVETLLVKGKVDVNARDEDDWTGLCWATFNGNMNVAKLLISHKALLNVADKQGRTPLYLSCGWGSGDAGIDIVRFLLEKNADLNQNTLDKWSPIFFCAFRGKTKTVKLLLECKANIFSLDAKGRSVIDIATSRQHHEIVTVLREAGTAALTNAARKGDIIRCKQILRANSADVNGLSNNGFTSLQYAAKTGNESLAQFLIERKADVSILSRDGSSILDITKASGNAHMDHIFQEHMKNCEIQQITDDFHAELRKQAKALQSGDFAIPVDVDPEFFYRHRSETSNVFDEIIETQLERASSGGVGPSKMRRAMTCSGSL